MDIATIKQAFKDNNVDLGKDDYWKVQSSYVIYHKAIERLGAALKIVWDEVRVLRCEREEFVFFARATRPDKDISEWSTGEALIGVNYKVSGKQAAYVAAMAEKRCKDRVILKLAGLHGAYSEDEAEDFKRENRTDAGDEASSRAQRPPLPDMGRPDNVVALKTTSEQPRNEVKTSEAQDTDIKLVDGVPVDADGVVQGQPTPDPKTPEGILAGLLGKIDDLQKAEDGDGIYRFMTEGGANDRAKALGNGPYTEVRNRANTALKALGWTPASKADAKAKPA